MCAGSVAATLGDSSACTAEAGKGRVGGGRLGDIFSGRSVAEVRDGHLLIRWDGPAGYCWKLLLRYLNLVPSEHATYGFSLVRPGCKSPLVTVIVSISKYYNCSQSLCFALTRRHFFSSHRPAKPGAGDVYSKLRTGLRQFGPEFGCQTECKRFVTKTQKTYTLI